MKTGRDTRKIVLYWTFLRSRLTHKWSVLDGKTYLLVYTPSFTDPDPAWTFLWPLKIIYIHIGSKSYLFKIPWTLRSSYAMGSKQRRWAGIPGRCPILNLPCSVADPWHFGVDLDPRIHSSDWCIRIRILDPDPGSGSWIRILDTDPAIFVIDLQDASKKQIF